MVDHQTHRDALLDRLLQQRQGLSGPSSECIGRTQGRGDPGDSEPDVCRLREVEGPFEHGMAWWRSPWHSDQKPTAQYARHAAVGVIGGLGNPHPFLGGRPPLGECAALGKVAGEETTGEHRGQPSQAKALME